MSALIIYAETSIVGDDAPAPWRKPQLRRVSVRRQRLLANGDRVAGAKQSRLITDTYSSPSNSEMCRGSAAHVQYDVMERKKTKTDAVGLSHYIRTITDEKYRIQRAEKNRKQTENPL